MSKGVLHFMDSCIEITLYALDQFASLNTNTSRKNESITLNVFEPTRVQETHGIMAMGSWQHLSNNFIFSEIFDRKYLFLLGLIIPLQILLN